MTDELNSNTSKFNRFSQAYPVKEPLLPIDIGSLTSFITETLGVEVPSTLVEFWETFGSGYFGEKDLYFFGDSSSELPRDSFADWNQKDFWKDIYPSPKEGGPVFFAETCFGEQIGYRWENGKCICILFVVDTFEGFVIASSLDELFSEVLVDRYALVDHIRLDGVYQRLGSLSNGMHYAPKVSPMLGGSGDESNFQIESPNVHFRTAVATYNAVKDLPPGASISDIKIEWVD